MNPVLTRTQEAIRPFVVGHLKNPPTEEESRVETVTTGTEVNELISVFKALEGASDGIDSTKSSAV